MSRRVVCFIPRSLVQWVGEFQYRRGIRRAQREFNKKQPRYKKLADGSIVDLRPSRFPTWGALALGVLQVLIGILAIALGG